MLPMTNTTTHEKIKKYIEYVCNNISEHRHGLWLKDNQIVFGYLCRVWEHFLFLFFFFLITFALNGTSIVFMNL